MDKKGQAIEQIQTLIPIIVAVGVILVVGFLVIGEMRNKVVELESSDFCNSSQTYVNNATMNVCCETGSQCIGVNQTMPGFTSAYNGSVATTDAMMDIPGWIPIIIITILGAILLSLVSMYVAKQQLMQ